MRTGHAQLKIKTKDGNHIFVLKGTEHMFEMLQWWTGTSLGIIDVVDRNVFEHAHSSPN